MHKSRRMLPAMFSAMIALLGAAVVTAIAQPQQSSLRSARDASETTFVTEADAYFQNQDWTNAARAYGAMAKREPSNGRAWFRLGIALHSTGDYERAIESFGHAIATGFQPSGAMVRIARSYAKANNKEKAFEWLHKAMEAGFNQFHALSTDLDLTNLRDDTRFKDVLAHAERNSKPCAQSAAHRQLDFWVGEWDVLNPQGQLAGTNSVQAILDGCAVAENWSGAGGGSGRSFNFFNPATRKWQQVWISSTGSALEFVGEIKDGVMRYTGESTGPNGGRLLHRMSITNLSADRIRQLWEQSIDGGRNWNVAFDGTYVRKK